MKICDFGGLGGMAINVSGCVILTSGARTPMELRASTDVSNLAFILGLTANQGVDSVGVTTWRCHKAAVGRRMGPFQVRVEKLADVSDRDSDSGESEDMATD